MNALLRQTSVQQAKCTPEGMTGSILNRRGVTIYRHTVLYFNKPGTPHSTIFLELPYKTIKK